MNFFTSFNNFYDNLKSFGHSLNRLAAKIRIFHPTHPHTAADEKINKKIKYKLRKLPKIRGSFNKLSWDEMAKRVGFFSSEGSSSFLSRYFSGNKAQVPQVSQNSPLPSKYSEIQDFAKKWQQCEGNEKGQCLSGKDAKRVLYGYLFSKDYYGPVSVKWVDHLLEKINNIKKNGGDPQLVFLARDTIGHEKIAQTLLRKYPQKYPFVCEKDISLAYLSRKVIQTTDHPEDRRNCIDYLRQLGVNEQKTVLFVDVGYAGSMIPKIKQLLQQDLNIPPQNILFDYLISRNPEVPGYVHTINRPLESIGTKTGGNIAIHSVEDPHSGLHTSPNRLLRLQNACVVPNSILYNWGYAKPEAITRHFCLKALEDFAQEIDPDILDYEEIRAHFDQYLKLYNQGIMDPVVPHESGTPGNQVPKELGKFVADHLETKVSKEGVRSCQNFVEKSFPKVAIAAKDEKIIRDFFTSILGQLRTSMDRLKIIYSQWESLEKKYPQLSHHAIKKELDAAFADLTQGFLRGVSLEELERKYKKRERRIKKILESDFQKELPSLGFLNHFPGEILGIYKNVNGLIGDLKKISRKPEADKFFKSASSQHLVRQLIRDFCANAQLLPEQVKQDFLLVVHHELFPLLPLENAQKRLVLDYILKALAIDEKILEGTMEGHYEGGCWGYMDPKIVEQREFCISAKGFNGKAPRDFVESRQYFRQSLKNIQACFEDQELYGEPSEEDFSNIRNLYLDVDLFDSMYDKMGSMYGRELLDIKGEAEIFTKLPLLFSKIKQKSEKSCPYFQGPFNPHFSGNLPHFLSFLKGAGKKISSFRTPTVCSDVYDSENKRVGVKIIPEFQGFLQALRKKNERHLYVNLMNRVSGNEKERSELLEETGRKNAAVMDCMTLDYNSSFYKQRGEFFSENPVDFHVFEEQFLNHFLTSPSFYFPENLKHIINRDSLKKLIRDIFKDFFAHKTHLTQRDRKAFIELVYARLVSNVIKGDSRFVSVNTSCKNHIDRGMLLSTVLDVMDKLDDKKLDQEDYQRIAMSLAPAVFVSDRAMQADKFERLMDTLQLLICSSNQLKRDKVFNPGLSKL